jgi:hypothetical protein
MARYRREKDPDREIYSKETGEIIGPVINTIYIQPENFSKLYNDSIEALLSINPYTLQVLLVATKYATFSEANGETGSFFSNDIVFKDNCRRLISDKLKNKTINQHVYDLAKANLITRRCRGTYLINPHCIIKGKSPKTPNSNM